MLPSLSHHFILVAQTRFDERIEPLQFGVEMSEPAGGSRMVVMLMLVLVTVAIAIAVMALLKRVAPRHINSGKLLFVELSRANHLSRRQRKLLLDMAAVKKVSCPSQMFLDISLWAPDREESVPEKPVLSKPGLSSDPKVQELHRLRSLLFTQGEFAPATELNSQV